jgi:hypothetical protein
MIFFPFEYALPAVIHCFIFIEAAAVLAGRWFAMWGTVRIITANERMLSTS